MEKLWLINGIKVKVVINLFNENCAKLNYQVGLNDVFGFEDIAAFAFYLKTTRGYEHYDICYCDEHTDINSEVDNVNISDSDVNSIIDKLCDLQPVKDELAGEIEYMVRLYGEENDLLYIEFERVLEAHANHQTDGSYYYDFIDNDMFLKCIGLSTGERTIDDILEDLELFEELDGDKNALEIFDYFDWDKYCEYYYNKVAGNKEIEVSFCNKTFIVLEAWPDIASGYICSDDEGCNMVFDTYEEAEKEAAECQCGIVLEV